MPGQPSRTATPRSPNDHDAAVSEEVEQTLENIDPNQRWQVTAARDILEHGRLGKDFPSFVTSYGYSHYQSGRPGPRSNLQTADPTGTIDKVTS
ncbi:MAG TPA: hypothetical protein VF086_00815 [Propionibacteriaceae bacterium]